MIIEQCTGQDADNNEGLDTVEINAPADEEFKFEDVNKSRKTPKRNWKTASRGQSNTKHGLPTPFTFMSQLTSDVVLSELERAKKENLEAEELLQQQEVKAEILQQRLQAEEKRHKALKIQQQNNKASKKVSTSKTRYEKDLQKSTKKKQAEQIAEPIALPVSQAKKALDSWLQTQSNLTSSHIEEFNEIKSIHSHIPMIERCGSVYKIAKELITDDNLSVCRETGIMKKKTDKSRDSSDSSRSSASTRSSRHRSPRRHDDCRNRTLTCRECSPARQGHSNRYNREEL